MISYLLCAKLFWDAMSKGSSKLSVVKVFWLQKKKLPKCSCLEIVLVVYLTQSVFKWKWTRIGIGMSKFSVKIKTEVASFPRKNCNI